MSYRRRNAYSSYYGSRGGSRGQQSQPVRRAPASAPGTVIG